MKMLSFRFLLKTNMGRSFFLITRIPCCAIQYVQQVKHNQIPNHPPPCVSYAILGQTDHRQDEANQNSMGQHTEAIRMQTLLKSILRLMFLAREMLVEAPSYLHQYLFSWLYPVLILRQKAACCPYPRTRRLILRRSGIRIGRQVEIGYGLVIIGRGKQPPAVEVGDRAAIAPCVTLVTSSYPNESRLLRLPGAAPLIKKFCPILIGEDAWIGTGAVLMPGVVIGRCAVVGAGAVVTRSVDPYSVVAGVPARLIRMLDEENPHE